MLCVKKSVAGWEDTCGEYDFNSMCWVGLFVLRFLVFTSFLDFLLKSTLRRSRVNWGEGVTDLSFNPPPSCVSAGMEGDLDLNFLLRGGDLLKVRSSNWRKTRYFKLNEDCKTVWHESKKFFKTNQTCECCPAITEACV